MKTNFLAKHKWWVLAIVLMIVLMAVSVSYSAWDTLSFSTLDSMKNGKSGNYEVKWNAYIKDADGHDLSVTDYPQVGDIVQFGRFYNDKDAAVTGSATNGKTEPLRWRVVNNDRNKLTLLAEKIVVYGNYWGNGEAPYSNNYYTSTVRSWLNSGRNSIGNADVNDNVRSDGFGSKFGEQADNTNQVNKGFLDVAFQGYERELLVPKNLSSMQYHKFLDENQAYELVDCTTATGKDFINDLVWLPSLTEMYGDADSTIDNADKQFSYFVQNTENNFKVTGGTPYAQNAFVSSYYNTGGGFSDENEGIAYWWLRSPNLALASDPCRSLIVGTDGWLSDSHPHDATGGVRPAVCVQL